jgi:hypothetical protein
MAKRQLTPAQLANLRPMQKGQPTVGPNGRKGNDGKGGVSLLASYRKFIQDAPPGMTNAIWMGLAAKAQSGDVKAIELFVRLNGESIVSETNTNEIASGTQVIINVPKMEE